MFDHSTSRKDISTQTHYTKHIHPTAKDAYCGLYKHYNDEILFIFIGASGSVPKAIAGTCSRYNDSHTQAVRYTNVGCVSS